MAEIKDALNEEGVTENMSNTQTLKQRTYRQKIKFEAKLPVIKTFKDIDFMPDMFKKFNEEEFLVHDVEIGNAGERMLIFLANSGKEILKCSDIWCGDGTFQSTPTPFNQVYIIYGNPKGKHILPACFALLPNKEAKTYCMLMDVVCKKVRNKPKKFILDFELGFISALKEIIPRTKLQGCFFHLKQSVYRQIQRRGLLKHYIAKSELKKAVQFFLLLVLYPKRFCKFNIQAISLTSLATNPANGTGSPAVF